MTLTNKNKFDKAQSVAINFINYRLRSEQELRIRLSKDFDELTVNKTISKMYDFGFLNDTRFAKIFTENRIMSRPKSSSYIKRELIQKGIEKDLASSVVQKIDDSEICLSLALKKSRSLSQLPWENFQKKMLGHLARKGFNYSTASSATKKAWSEIQPDS
jgi:regulatory protein